MSLSPAARPSRGVIDLLSPSYFHKSDARTSGDREEEPPVRLFGPFYRRSVTSAPVRWDDLRLFWHEKVHYMVPLPHLQARGVKKDPSVGAWGQRLHLLENRIELLKNTLDNER